MSKKADTLKTLTKKVYNKYPDEYISELADKLDVWINEPDKFWLGSFAADNGFGKQRLTEFAAKNDKFASAYERAKQIQENKLFMLGLSGKGNVTMAIFALKNVAGWRDIKEEEKENWFNEEIEIVPKITNMDRYKQYMN